MECARCGIEMDRKTERKEGMDVTVNVCPQCGDGFLDLEDALKLQQQALERVKVGEPTVVISESLGTADPAGLRAVFAEGGRVRLTVDPDSSTWVLERE